MAPTNSIKYSEITDAHYTVTINLQNFLNEMDLCEFKKDLKAISNDCADGIGDIYKFDGNKLTYISETLFPPERNVNNQKVLIVFGNPAFHSIKNGMFFFSRANNQRHSMWGKLQKATLIKPVRFENDDLFLARKQEAEERKKIISEGQASEEYCLGLTTFYSFPTPVEGRFRDVQGVEKLFKAILEKTIIPFEVNRILKYPFTQNATIVFVQKSSYEAFKRNSNQSALLWPIRGQNSSGDYLSQILWRHIKT